MLAHCSYPQVKEYLDTLCMYLHTYMYLLYPPYALEPAVYLARTSPRVWESLLIQWKRVGGREVKRELEGKDALVGECSYNQGDHKSLLLLASDERAPCGCLLSFSLPAWDWTWKLGLAQGPGEQA